tara:strand:+ start:232 stop:1167 length:936 start_codon:yes stop_codon:yes gene_type:complete
MGLVVSSLTDYVNQQSKELLVALAYEGKTSPYLTPIAGVKKTEALQLFALTAYPQEASGCDLVASGSATFTQRELTVSKIGYRDELCMDALLPKWTQMLLAPGAAGEDEITAQLGQTMTDELKKLIVENIEVAIWQGDLTSGDAVKKMFDGYIKIITAATAINGNSTNITTGTGITTTNVIGIVNGMCAARTEELKHASDQVLFCGTDTFDKYVQALETANLYHVDQTKWVNYEMGVIGKNVTLVGVPGLSGTSKLYLGQKRNFFKGFDLLDDSDKVEWKILESDKMRYTAKFKFGVQVAYPSEIVEFILV